MQNNDPSSIFVPVVVLALAVEFTPLYVLSVMVFPWILHKICVVNTCVLNVLADVRLVLVDIAQFLVHHDSAGAIAALVARIRVHVRVAVFSVSAYQLSVQPINLAATVHASVAKHVAAFGHGVRARVPHHCESPGKQYDLLFLSLNTSLR